MIAFGLSVYGDNVKSKKWIPYAGECLACAFIAFLGLGLTVPFVITGSISSLFEFSVLYGMVFAVTIIIFAPVSGAQIDPAFTLAWALSGTVRFRQLLLCILVQIIGWTVGSGAVYAVNGSAIARWAAETGNDPVGLLLCSRDPCDTLTVFLAETGLTALLIFVVCVFLDEVFPHRPSRHTFPFAVGALIAFILIIGCPVSGACVNFARDLGARIAACVWGIAAGYDITSVFGSGQWLVYLLSCAAGAVLGWLFYRLIRKMCIEIGGNRNADSDRLPE